MINWDQPKLVFLFCLRDLCYGFVLFAVGSLDKAIDQGKAIARGYLEAAAACLFRATTSFLLLEELGD